MGQKGGRIGTGASCHVRYDYDMFKNGIVDDMKMLLKDSHTSTIVETGNVELQFTSENILLMKDVIHTLDTKRI